jgi:5-(carboxyamino)imidazole ribonucleotide synthase
MAAEAGPLPPGSTIGVLGGGQLGRMLAMAAARLGFRTHVFAPDAESPAFEVAFAQTVAGYDDAPALDDFARRCAVVTYEFENVAVAAVERLAAILPVRPGARALEVSQDRLAEKRFLRGLGVATADFAALDDDASLAAALATIGCPAVLKTRRLGYDGKGQALVRRREEAASAFEAIGRRPAILERRVDFACEASVIAVRGADGRAACYDPARNEHVAGMLRRSAVPAGLAPAIERQARAIAASIVEALGYVGVIGVEFFVIGEGESARLLVNEFAPRVHNSGHWTEDACAVSQFENHIRAVVGWPLGPTGRHADVVMTNLIGDDASAWAALAAEPGARLHLYGKRETRPARKMGHVNRLAPFAVELAAVRKV